jgi:hypothetical protein
MKVILLTASMLCIISYTAQGQSTMEFQSGTHIEVMSGADICADNIIINGTFSGSGTLCEGSGASANIKVFLQGCYNGGSMVTDLYSRGYIPITQPYNISPWNYSGVEDVGAIPPGVVDWVLVELRTNETTVAGRRAGFLKSDGTITDVDGSSQLFFGGVSSGDYYVVVRHRDHLAVMSSAAVSLSAVSPLYDFTTAQTQAHGTNPMADLGSGKYGMISGDTNGDGIVDATDRSNAWNDRLQTGYKNSDVSLDGIVDASDRSDIWNMRLLQTKVP